MEECYGTEGMHGSEMPGRGHAETGTTGGVRGDMCVVRWARCSPNPFPFLPKLPVTFSSPLAIREGAGEVMAKRNASGSRCTPLSATPTQSCPARSCVLLPLPHKSCVNDGSITDGRVLGS